jgi:hypothetical protein
MQYQQGNWNITILRPCGISGTGKQQPQKMKAMNPARQPHQQLSVKLTQAEYELYQEHCNLKGIDIREPIKAAIRKAIEQQTQKMNSMNLKDFYSHLAKGGTTESYEQLQSISILIGEAVYTRGRTPEQVAEFFINLLQQDFEKDMQADGLQAYADTIIELIGDGKGNFMAADFMQEAIQRLLIARVRRPM